jgi:RNA polymerase primary sigma factor
MTLEQVGKKFKISRERVRQIQDAALRKLRRLLEQLETPAHIQLS